jgi:thiol-disulfide isomerase/thioredoxin
MSTPKSRRRENGKGVSRVEIIVGLVILFLVVWGGYSLSQPSPPSTTTTLTTATSGAPDFTLPVVGPNGLTGEKVSLSSFRGKVVLLEFMVPWCPHCQNMGPVLQNLYKQYGSQNVVFLTVSGAWAQSAGGTPTSPSDVAKFIQTYGSTWTYVYDSSNTVFNNYGVNSTPVFFIIDKNGRVAYTFQGEVAPDTLAADLSRLNA